MQQQLDQSRIFFGGNGEGGLGLKCICEISRDRNMRSEDGPPGSASGPGPARLPALNVKGGLSAHSARKVQEFLDQNFTRKIALAEMAAVCGLSSYHFVRAFSRTFRVPPHQYVLHRRVTRAEALIRNSSMPLRQIALEAGFAHQSHMANSMKRLLGISPGAITRARN